LVIDLKESNSAVVIGSPTGGDTGNRPKIFKTKHGFKYRITTRKPPQVSNNGFPMEGIGIKPHFEIHQTIDDFLKNRDTVLEFTIEKITSNSP
jgi:carboxyl-terminal processing protease